MNHCIKCGGEILYGRQHLKCPPEPVGVQPRRPVNDALLATVMYMIIESHRINMTGKTFEMVEDEARQKLYDALDSIKPNVPPTPPAGSEPYWYGEYKMVFEALQTIRNRLGLEPDAANGLDIREVVAEVNNLVDRVHRLQNMAEPTPQDPLNPRRPFGTDWNSVAYHIGRLLRVNHRGEKP